MIVEETTDEKLDLAVPGPVHVPLCMKTSEDEALSALQQKNIQECRQQTTVCLDTIVTLESQFLLLVCCKKLLLIHC